MPLTREEMAQLRRRVLREHRRAEKCDTAGRMEDAVESYARVAELVHIMRKFGQEHLSEDILQLEEHAVARIEALNFEWAETRGDRNPRLLRALAAFARGRIAVETVLRYTEEGALSESQKKECLQQMRRTDKRIDETKRRARRPDLPQ